MADRLSLWFGALLEDARKSPVPFYFVRFEDLISEPKPILEDLMKLLLNLDNLEGTNAQRRVDEVIGMGPDATKVYKLKANTKVPNKNVTLYSADQQAYIKSKLDFFIRFFDYAQYPDQPENPTGFYSFESSDEGQDVAGFRALNAKSIMTNAAQEEPKTYVINDPARRVEVIDKDNSIKVPRAVIHDAQMRMFGKALNEVN